MSPEHLFELLIQNGGSIISSNDLHPNLIEQARASNRMYVDSNGYGFVWEPAFAGRFPETEQEVIDFEKWYPLKAELPEHLISPDKILARLKQEKLEEKQKKQN